MNEIRQSTTVKLEPVFLRPRDAAAALGVSRSSLYQLIQSRRLRIVKLGASTLVPLQAIRELAAELERESEAERG